MTMIGVSVCMFLLVSAHPGCSGQNSESHIQLCVCVCVHVCLCIMTVSSKEFNV